MVHGRVKGLSEDEVAAQTLWLFDLANGPKFDTLPVDIQESIGGQIEHFTGATLSSCEINDCYKLVQIGLRALLYGKPWTTRIEVEYSLNLAKGSQLDINAAVPRGNANLFRRRMVQTLSAAKDRLRRCQRRGCVKVFLRIGKQAYCTERCAGKERLSKYRAKIKSRHDSEDDRLLGPIKHFARAGSSDYPPPKKYHSTRQLWVWHLAVDAVSLLANTHRPKCPNTQYPA